MKKIILILCLALTACVSTSNTPSILAGQVCGKSCWNDIVIGKTDKQEMLDILAILPGVNQDSIRLINGPHGIFEESIYFSLYKDEQGEKSLVNVSAYIRDQKVSAIHFNGKLGIKFQDIAEIFGEPESVFTTWDPRGYVGVNCISSSQGIIFSISANSKNSRISPKSEIGMFEFFDPNSYQQLLESNWLIPGYNEFILYPWKGFGKIVDDYWPPR